MITQLTESVICTCFLISIHFRKHIILFLNLLSVHTYTESGLSFIIMFSTMFSQTLQTLICYNHASIISSDIIIISISIIIHLIFVRESQLISYCILAGIYKYIDYILVSCGLLHLFSTYQLINSHTSRYTIYTHTHTQIYHIQSQVSTFIFFYKSVPQS